MSNGPTTFVSASHSLILAMLLGVALRLPFLSVEVLNLDEAVSMLVGQSIAEGGLPYQDVVDHRGPLTYYLYAGMGAMFGEFDFMSIRICYLLLLMAGIWLCYLIGKAVGDGTTGGFAALFFAIFSWTNAPRDYWAAHTEWLMIILVMLGVWIFLRYGNALWGLFVAGFCIGLAALSKQVAAWDVLMLSLFPLLAFKDQNFKWVHWFFRSALAAAGFLLPILLCVLFFWQQGGLEDLYEYAWKYNVSIYMPAVSFSSRLIAMAALLLDFFARRWLLAIFIGLGLWQMWQHRKQIFKPEKSDLLWIWLALATIGTCTSGRFFPHYHIQMLGPACLLAANVLCGGGSREGRRGGLPGGRRGGLQSAPTVWLKTLLIAGLLLPIGDTLLRHYAEIKTVWNPPVPVAEISYLKDISQQDDRLFVWGFAPELYIQAERKAASRYVFCNFLTGFVPWERLEDVNTDAFIMGGSWEKLMQDFEAHPPDWILDTSGENYQYYGHYPISRYVVLQQFVATHYEPDIGFGEQFPESGFVLYRKKP